MPHARKLFDRYIIETLIGEGHFGRVYLGRDTVLPRPVAIKELKSRWIADPGVMKRFVNDARAAAQLQHANIVIVHDLLPHDKPRFIILERLSESLREAMNRKGKLAVDECARFTSRICSALQLAHSRGIIHRDIKPENLLLTSSGDIKVCDFGIAHLPIEMGGGGTDYADGHPGTLIYRSPEQVHGTRLDGRSDLYTVGAVLYEMLTSRHYFDYSRCGSRHDIDEAILRERPISLRQIEPMVSPELDALVMRLLEKDAAARFQNAEAVENALAVFSRRGDLVDGVVKPALTLLSATVRREGSRNRFQVMIEATNEGTAEANNWSGLTLHFPALCQKEPLDPHDIRAWGSADPFFRQAGDMIWGYGDDGKWSELRAKHLMAEFAVQKWSPGERLHLEVSLTLDLPEIQIHARAWGGLKKANGIEILNTDPPRPSNSVKDQQGFPCNLLICGLTK